MDISIASIDKASYCRLRNPSNHLVIDGPFNTIEDVAAVSEDILNIALSIDLMLESVLPFENFGKLSVIPSLDTLDFMFEQSDPSGKSFRCSEVVCPVAEGFEEFIGRMVLVDGRVTVVFLSDFDVGLQALREHLFHFFAVS